MSNIKNRIIKYRGFEISLEYDSGAWENISKGWVINIYDEVNNKDYGGNGERIPSLKEAIKEGKFAIDTILD